MTSGVTKRQSAVYKAEIASGCAWCGAYILPAYAQAALDTVVKSKWWRRRTAVRRLELRWAPGGVFCYGHQPAEDPKLGIVRVTSMGLAPAILYHESAHILAADEAEDHGSIWMRAYVDMLDRFYGPWAAELMQESFEKYGLWPK